MSYKSLREALEDLPKHEILWIEEVVDPNLVMAEIHRRVHEVNGPALYFSKVKNSPFPALSNLYGTKERVSYLFRNELDNVRQLIKVKSDPSVLLRNPMKYSSVPFTALKGLPRKVKAAPVLRNTTDISLLPQIVSWPMDGGSFVTLPQVMTLPPGEKRMMKSNIGMYRIQLSGNDYQLNREAGMHYQLHRGIGVHHTQYNQTNDPFRVSIFIGGPPSHSFAAIMPLPEDLSEVTFAGLLNGRRYRYTWNDHYPISAEADFCITGIIRNDLKPEGPFGDHLGYYSLKHDFPVLEVDKVYHRKDPIWHFTVVGRPPQEDSLFGWLIHELVEPLAPSEFPGLKEVHAVDAAGVHPLLLALGHERYMPFRNPVPEEILTIANHLLGKGQTSLAKFIWIGCADDQPSLSTHDIPAFFTYMLERINFQRDLHFHTNTTIDTLDYSGDGWNAGSKLILAARGPAIRTLSAEIPHDFTLPSGFDQPKILLPGVLSIKTRPFTTYEVAREEIRRLEQSMSSRKLDRWPLWILTEDSEWMSASLNNFLWATFTRAQPSKDVYGFEASFVDKHWGCDCPMIIDARLKPHHAPVLESDPGVIKMVDSYFAKGGFLHNKVKGL